MVLPVSIAVKVIVGSIVFSALILKSVSLLSEPGIELIKEIFGAVNGMSSSGTSVHKDSLQTRAAGVLMMFLASM